MSGQRSGGGGERNRRLQEQLRRVLADLRQALLPEDEAVVEAFLHAPHHLSDETLLERLPPSGVDLSQVKRVLRQLCELGIAQQVRLGGKTVYEHLHLESHHDHLVCVRCGKIVEFYEESIEQRQQDICRRHGFTPLMHKLELRGICQECTAATPATRPLSACLPGEQVVVAEILGGQALRRRLLDLGLPPGTPLRVINAEGPVTVEVRGSRVAFGHNEAAKIIVKASQS